MSKFYNENEKIMGNMIAYDPVKGDYKNITFGGDFDNLRNNAHDMNIEIVKIMNSTDPRMERVIPSDIYVVGHGPAIIDEKGKLLAVYGASPLASELTTLINDRIEKFGRDGVVSVPAHDIVNAVRHEDVNRLGRQVEAQVQSRQEFERCTSGASTNMKASAPGR
ncbi:hypothetical protein SAMN06295912_104120 [Sphingomonas laterariae]|uniref:Uncharacterized protein n=1 Tax=Edaphosphingomonas laterariae TaxID=861865 RepID=A0A239DIL4_9SPHN|nr:hypothetical protein [Sphingomonas laterariae]SNS32079.1 hypothetical protein SAMN06295912_104120 [Sphingomonas laterariae]